MAKIGIVDRCLEYSQDSEMKLEMFKNVDTECITPFDFFLWPVKCIKTKKIDIELHLFSSSVTTISLSGTNLNRNTFFDLLFES